MNINDLNNYLPIISKEDMSFLKYNFQHDKEIKLDTIKIGIENRIKSIFSLICSYIYILDLHKTYFEHLETDNDFSTFHDIFTSIYSNLDIKLIHIYYEHIIYNMCIDKKIQDKTVKCKLYIDYDELFEKAINISLNIENYFYKLDVSMPFYLLEANNEQVNEYIFMCVNLHVKKEIEEAYKKENNFNEFKKHFAKIFSSINNNKDIAKETSQCKGIPFVKIFSSVKDNKDITKETNPCKEIPYTGIYSMEYVDCGWTNYLKNSQNNTFDSFYKISDEKYNIGIDYSKENEIPKTSETVDKNNTKDDSEDKKEFNNKLFLDLE